jgi:protein TonB
MKRKTEKVPEFDEIIFENRNKSYGAYNLRKNYKSTASLSILGGITFSAILISALSLTTERSIAGPMGPVVVIVTVDPSIPKFVPPPTPKIPARLTSNIRNLKPEVTDDTSKTTPFIPSTDQLLSLVQNGNPNDNVSFTTLPDPVIPEETEPRIIVQEMPEFPGGLPALYKFVGENLKYPADAQVNNIQGKVILKFVVKPDGSVGRIEILRGVDSLLDNEATRVVNTLPRFKPGKQDGLAVPVWFMLPVVFKLENN